MNGEQALDSRAMPVGYGAVRSGYGLRSAGGLFAASRAIEAAPLAGDVTAAGSALPALV